ncbi:DUF305 domain-containing protein [Microtetraspora malaysiensis]|uniref:DUF305 domain-containing protein n=1 Tax=Microtetraspora malaysiensis TaxID=161358 RepID=A0ABW6T0P3_9ACTN
MTAYNAGTTATVIVGVRQPERDQTTMFTNRSFTRGLALATTATAGALLLTACGGDSTTGHKNMTGMAATSTAPAAGASSQAGADFNDADAMFAQMMIPHHKQAVEMADLAATRATDQEVKDLAAKIKAAQDPEIATMSGWLTAWGKPVTSSDGMAGHGMPGMMGENDMAKLKAAKGVAFDKKFAEMMIAHHNGAIEMARTEQAQGANPEAKKLAATIKAAQQAEVAQMQKIIDRL